MTGSKRPVLNFAWSPRGDQIAFTSADEPGTGEQRREQEREDADVFGESWQFARLRLVSLATGEQTMLAGGPRHISDIVWSPLGDALAFVSATAPGFEFDTHEVCLERVTVEGGALQLLCRLPRRPAPPVWSTDGNFLLYLNTADGLAQGSLVVWSVSAQGGEPKHLTAGHDCCASYLAQPVGAGRLAVMIGTGLETHLCWLDPETGSLVPFYHASHPGESGELTNWSLRLLEGGQAVLAAVRSSGQRPAEVWSGTFNVEGKLDHLAPRSNHQAALRDVQFASQEPFRWEARDGWELDGQLLRPPSSGALPLPLIVLVHGGPYARSGHGFNLSNSNWAQWLATAGYCVLLPNPRGGYGHGHRFASAARGDVGGADYGDVLSAVDAAISRGIADPDRLGIGGWSQGGFMTAWAITQTNRFKAAVMGAGVTDWGLMAMTSDMPAFEAELGGSVPWDGVGPHRHAQLSPISFASRVATPVLILHGQNDARVPLGQVVGFHRALRATGATTEFVTYPREPHGIAERAHQIDLLNRVRAWYARWLGPGLFPG